MRVRLIVVLSLLTAMAGDGHAAAPERWEEIEDSLSYRRLLFRSERGGAPVVVHAFRFCPKRFALRVLSAEPESGGATVRDLAAGSGAVLAVNGSFFLEDRSPLGLVVSEGQEENPLRRANWGVFYLARGRAGVVHRRDWDRPAGLEFAIQAGPRLVVAGEPLSFKPQRARRTALGIAEDGDVLVVATEGALFTSDMAALMARPEADGGLGCRHALNLDGGSSTQLWFDREGRRVEISARGSVANAVGLFRR